MYCITNSKHPPVKNQIVSCLYLAWNHDVGAYALYLGRNEMYRPVIKGFSNTGGTDQLVNDVIRQVVGIATTALEKPNEPH